MCYDISFTVGIESIYDYFPELIADEQIEINYDLSAHIAGHLYTPHPIVYRNKEDTQLHLRLMEWGIIPYYITDEKSFLSQRASMLNIRSERILDDKKSYWYKIRNKRCLIPLTGTYEHRVVVGWKKKVPYLIKPANRKLFFVPGLFSMAELPDKDGVMQQRWTMGMITRSAKNNKVMKNIHNAKPDDPRMPLFLHDEMCEQWMNKDLSENEYREILNFEFPANELEYYAVDTIRSPKPRADGKPKNMPFEWAGLPALGEANPA